MGLLGFLRALVIGFGSLAVILFFLAIVSAVVPIRDQPPVDGYHVSLLVILCLGWVVAVTSMASVLWRD